MNPIAALMDRYFRPGQREAVLYERLGVRRFKRYLPTGGDLYANRVGWHPIGDRRGGLAASLERFVKRTRLAETAHLITLVFFAAITAVAIAAGSYIPALLLTAFNVGFNVYPIMVQRYNRHRMLRLLERGASVDADSRVRA